MGVRDMKLMLMMLVCLVVQVAVVVLVSENTEHEWLSDIGECE